MTKRSFGTINLRRERIVQFPDPNIATYALSNMCADWYWLTVLVFDQPFYSRNSFLELLPRHGLLSPLNPDKLRLSGFVEVRHGNSTLS